MKIELKLLANGSPVGSKTYGIRDYDILGPVRMVLDDFAFSVLDWAAPLPQSGLSPVKLAKFLDRDKSYVSAETMNLRINRAEKSEQEALDHIKKLELKVRELQQEPHKLRRQLRATKRAAARLFSQLNSKEPAEPILYYRVYALSSWGPHFVRTSYGKNAQEAIERFRRIYKIENAMLHIEQIKNPKLKYVYNEL